MGGADDFDENQACALESLVDTLLLQASNAFETAEITSNSITAETKSCFAASMSEEDVAKARVSVPKKTKQIRNIVCVYGMIGVPIAAPEPALI